MPSPRVKRHASSVPGWVGVWDGLEPGARTVPDELPREYAVPLHGHVAFAACTTREDVDRLLTALVRELDPEDSQRDE